jgi:hypothetical protein
MKRPLLYILIGISGFLAYSGLIEPNWIATRSYHMVIDGLASEEITVVHIADIHITGIGYRERTTAQMIRQINPDYVFLTGDLLMSGESLPSGLEYLEMLTARRGVYVVPGNADGAIVSSLGRKLIQPETDSYTILCNESVRCDDFTLVGIGDPVTGQEDLDEAFRGIDGARPTLVICHFHPDSLLLECAKQGVDMIFSGHTHGGQIGLATVIGLVPYAFRSRYIAGLYDVGDMHLSVTSGVGVNIFPLRFLRRPEVVVFHLKGR